MAKENNHWTLIDIDPLPNGILGKALISLGTELGRDGLATSSISFPGRDGPPSREKEGWGERKACGAVNPGSLLIDSHAGSYLRQAGPPCPGF